MKKLGVVSALMSVFCINSLIAQSVELVPLGEGNAVLRQHYQDNPYKNSQNCSDAYVTLPFFDDFANNVGWHPDCSRWQDNHAFINNSMASNPPSVGVATLDGLNPVGEPYNQAESTSFSSPADTMTSQLFDFSTMTTTSQLILSYFYQPQGLADRPEETDSLIVEFRDSSNTWNLVKVHAGVDPNVSSMTILDFEQAFLAIDDVIYLHDSFQFRFRNYAAIAGNNDHWHIDYVYLDENRTDTVAPVYYSDMALTALPPFALNTYTAMPWQQFTMNDLNESIEVYTYNHSNVIGDLDRTYTVEDVDGGTILLNSPLQTVIQYGESPDANDELIQAGFSGFQNLTLTGPNRIRSTYQLDNPTDFQNAPRYVLNDTVRRTTYLDNYYAYDDGSAETRIIAQGIGTDIAVEYQTNIADTLRGMYLHMPYYLNRDATQDFVNLKVWVDSLSDSSEVFSRDIYKLEYEEGFNGYFYFELADFTGELAPIALNAGQKFYVGWEQASSTSVPIGYDRNMDARSVTYVGVGGVWETTDILLPGAVMIRPLLSIDPDYPIVDVKEVVAPTKSPIEMMVYPNPAYNMLNIAWSQPVETNGMTIRVFNALGQIVMQENYNDQLDINNLENGLFVLEVRNELGEVASYTRFLKAE